MLENVRLISKVNKVERREALIKILKKNDLKYKIQHEKLRNHFVDNIIVTFNSEIKLPKLVIGAHYDNIEGSCGANDNASGVSILIEVAKYLKLNKVNRPIDLVFFDREEYEDRGSEQYILSTGRENIYAMINIDTCGFGDMMLIGPEKNLGAMKEKKIISEGLLDKEYIEIIKRTPVKVIDIYKYNNFEELYKEFNKVKLGYREDEIAHYTDMEQYYSKEDIAKYGVIGIELEVKNILRL